LTKDEIWIVDNPIRPVLFELAVFNTGQLFGDMHYYKKSGEKG